MGTNVYLHTASHEKIIQKGYDPGEYVNKVVKKALEEEEAGGTKG